MSILNVAIGSNKVDRVTATVNTIAEQNTAAQLFQAISLPLRLLNDTLKERASGPAEPLPRGETELFLCACGDRFTSTEAAVDHVEQDHASERIRQDFDKLEALIEVLVIPNPLPPPLEPTETLPLRTWHDELLKEIVMILDGEKLLARAECLIRATKWGLLKGCILDDVKEQIVNYGEDAPKIRRPQHKDFLTVFAIFRIQVEQADPS
jgi:hypothetical protein